MFGIINNAIEDLVKEKWESIKEERGIDVDFFISDQTYDDSITYDLGVIGICPQALLPTE
jgi:hypothetical protein